MDPRALPLPRVIEASAPKTPLVDWAREHAVQIDSMLDEHGGLLFRGFEVGGQEGLKRFVDVCSGEAALDYVYRSTPRTALGDKVYTATEYPASKSIPMHNENAYQDDWPMRLFFLCVTA